MATESIRKFAFIDALRGWAIMLVLLVHASGCVPALAPALKPILANGARGVQLFYIVSALTLFLSFESRVRRERRPVVNFFIRRFFRIVPMFYLVLWYFHHLTGYKPQYWTPMGLSFRHYLAAATFTNGWVPSAINLFPGGWSIAIETNFYLILPLLFFFVKSFNRAVLFTLVTLVLAHDVYGTVLHWYLPLYQPQHRYVVQEFMNLYLVSQLPVFALGILIYFVLRGPLRDKCAPSPEQARERYRRSLVLLAVSGFLVYSLSRPGIVMYISNAFAFGLAFFCLVWALALQPHKLFVNWFTCYIGKISYSAYLIHYLILTGYGNEAALKLMLKMHWPQTQAPLRLAMVYGVTLLYTIAVASLTYFIVELPTQKLGGHIIKRLETGKMQPAAAAVELPAVPTEVS